MRLWAELRPDATAYTYLEGDRVAESLTFAELWQRVRALGARLQAEMGPGDRAVLLYPPGLDFVVAFLGGLAAEVIVVPAYPPDSARSAPRLRALVDSCASRVALTTTPIASVAEAMTKQLPELRGLRLVTTDGLGVSGFEDWRATRAAARRRARSWCTGVRPGATGSGCCRSTWPATPRWPRPASSSRPRPRARSTRSTRWSTTRGSGSA
ncbi:MAG: AMP-binding protein [Myxococcales bacterium]|nr:AMP-binding protein [Myxococcales bacterium]